MKKRIITSVMRNGKQKHIVRYDGAIFFVDEVNPTRIGQEVYVYAMQGYLYEFIPRITLYSEDRIGNETFVAGAMAHEAQP